MKILIFLSHLFLFPILALSPAQAGQEFTTDYKVVYLANEKGELLVNQEVSLTNKFSHIYATEYSFIIEKGQPKNIAAFDESGPLPLTSQTNQEITTIKISFPRPVVGKNKTLKFWLSYELPELIRHLGQLREVTIPKLADPASIDNYNLTLKIPLSFGSPAFISPLPFEQKTEDESQLFFFNKNQLSQTGVMVAFGEFQIFDFSLSYFLNNPSANSIMTKVALPPDTNLQTVAYHQLNPPPLNIEVDADGNWLALYSLEGKQTLKVIAEGQVKIFAKKKDNQAVLSPSELERYLQPQKYWESQESTIQPLAQNLKTPREIFDFVVETLDYDYSRVRKGAVRLGALAALQTPQKAICTEYTDLFITLARAAGIPARELNGFAYTTNPWLKPLSLVQDILHAWPEYWDFEKETWVQVDPTWQDTTGGVDYFSKIDLGHFVFAIHGQNSQFPLPAGAYKSAKTSTKDIQISFGQYRKPTPPVIKADFLLPQKIFGEMTTEGKIKLNNLGEEALYNLNLEIITQNFKLLTPRTLSIAVLPPFSSKEIPVKIKSQQPLSSGLGKIELQVNNQKFKMEIASSSLILRFTLPVLGILLLMTIIGLSFSKIKGHFSPPNKI